MQRLYGIYTLSKSWKQRSLYSLLLLSRTELLEIMPNYAIPSVCPCLYMLASSKVPLLISWGTPSLCFPQQAVGGFHRTQTEESRASWCDVGSNETHLQTVVPGQQAMKHEMNWNVMKSWFVKVRSNDQPSQGHKQKHHFKEGLG